MNFKNKYWFFKSIVPLKICNDIIDQALKQRSMLGLTGTFGQSRNVADKPLTNKEIKELHKKRNSQVVWINQPWIHKEIIPYVRLANKNANWNFEWDDFEDAQFTYYKKDHHYGWHCDSWDEPYQEGLKKGKIRKLTSSLVLSDPADYKGGELEFDFRQYDPPARNPKVHVTTIKESLPKGSILVFPSFFWHQIKPITKGMRYSLLIWYLGSPFK